MQILHAFSAERAELSLTELGEMLDIHKSIVSRLAATLMEWRMLSRDPETKKFRLGLGAPHLGMLVANSNPLHRLALPLLGALAARTRQTAHVSVLDRTEALVIETVESPDALRVILRQGDRRPLHATAAGKVLLAYMPHERAREIIADTGLPELTSATATSAAALEKMLLVIRAEGLAWNEGESAIGAGAAAAPVFAADGSIAAAVSVVFPLNLVRPAGRKTIATHVQRSAAELSVGLGWQGQWPNPGR